jgi:hypothetical protein
MDREAMPISNEDQYERTKQKATDLCRSHEPTASG